MPRVELRKSPSRSGRGSSSQEPFDTIFMSEVSTSSLTPYTTVASQSKSQEREDQHLLRTALKVIGSPFTRTESACAFEHHVHVAGSPVDLVRITGERTSLILSPSTAKS